MLTLQLVRILVVIYACAYEAKLIPRDGIYIDVPITSTGPIDTTTAGVTEQPKPTDAPTHPPTSMSTKDTASTTTTNDTVVTTTDTTTEPPITTNATTSTPANNSTEYTTTETSTVSTPTDAHTDSPPTTGSSGFTCFDDFTTAFSTDGGCLWISILVIVGGLVAISGIALGTWAIVFCCRRGEKDAESLSSDSIDNMRANFGIPRAQVPTQEAVQMSWTQPQLSRQGQRMATPAGIENPAFRAHSGPQDDMAALRKMLTENPQLLGQLQNLSRRQR